MPSDLVEALAAVALLAPPIFLTRAILRKNAGVRARRYEAFVADLAGHGFVMRAGSSHEAYALTGAVGAVPIAIESFGHRTQSGSKTYTTLRLAVRVEARAPIGRGAVYPSGRVPVTELGPMREVPLPPELAARYRAYVEDPAHGAFFLGEAAREALLGLGAVASLETTSSAIVLALESTRASPAILLRAAELVAALQEQRAPSPSPPLPADPGWESPWLGAALVPLVLGAALGIPLSCAPPVHVLATPLVCPDGTHVINRGTNKNPLQCVDEQAIAREPAHAVTLLVGGSLAYYPMLLYALFRARRRVRAGREEAQRPAGPYR